MFDSPYFNQNFASTTSQIPIQTWLGNTAPVTIECSQAYHGGLYPPGVPEKWSLVTTITPSTKPSYDTTGSAIFSAGVVMPLPPSCWHEDGNYKTALRATQVTNGVTTTFNVFDRTGLECLGREVGKAASWGGWIGKKCAMTYPGTSTAVPWVVILADALGTSAAVGASSAAAMDASVQAPAAARSMPVTEAVMSRAFQAESIDTQWSTGMDARLRMAYDMAHPEGTMLMDASCRSTLCRVEVRHVDQAARDRFVSALAPAGLFTNDGVSGMAFHDVSSPGLRSVYFIGREDVKPSMFGKR